MKKQVILTVIPGNLEQGLSVVLRIFNSIDSEPEIGELPPAPGLLELFQQWQKTYREAVSPNTRIKLKPVEVTYACCQDLSSQFVLEFNRWLNSGYKKWQRLREKLQRNLSPTDEILFIIQSDSVQIQQLPWHLWDIFSEDYPQAEVALSLTEHDSLKSKNPLNSKIKVLAILGDSTGIDIQKDRSLLESLPGAEVTFLVEPKHKELNEQLWEQGWDILFFAGHSSTQELNQSGQIWINQTESLTIDRLKYALQTAVKHGLKLAIFNSCDGLGIAKDLACLQITQIIVMREPVPDRIAQEFLKYFLSAFSSGKTFYLSVREAREKLQGLETEFPCASWLPVIFQSPDRILLDWQVCSNRRQYLSAIKRGSLAVLSFAMLTTSIVMGARYSGIFQPLELQAFDLLLRARPEEQRDERLLIVTVTEEDLHLPQQQKRNMASLSDLALNQALEKLEKHQPIAVGVDIYRDFPVDPSVKGLSDRLRQNQSLVAVCKISDPTVKDPGVAPPPEIPLDRLGFSDFLSDPDEVLRRQLLITGSDPASPCTAPYAFSIQLAFHYLIAKGVMPKYTHQGVLQLGNKLIKPLESHQGGYQATNILPYQLLLNYRSKEVAPTATLEQLLNNKVKPEAIKGRIVLIGTVANSFRDYWRSPYSSADGSAERFPGVMVQAQMISQVISAVLDGRPLLWAYPFWKDVIFVFGCSVVGGGLAFAWLALTSRTLMQPQVPIFLGVAIATGEVLLCGLSFWGLTYSGWWMPLIPCALALPITSGLVVAYEKSNRGGSKHKFIENE